MTQLSKIAFNPKISKIILDDEKRELLAKNLKNFDRDLEMSKLYIEWATLTQIGEQYWISRERARQIVGRVAGQQKNLIKIFDVVSKY